MADFSESTIIDFDGNTDSIANTPLILTSDRKLSNNINLIIPQRLILKSGVTYGTKTQMNNLSSPDVGQVFFVIQ